MVRGKEVARLNHIKLSNTLLFTLLLCYFQYQIFIPMVNKVMLKHRINHQRYDVLICRIVKVSPPIHQGYLKYDKGPVSRI